MLENQYKEIQNDIIGISTTATKLRDLVFTDDKMLKQHDLLIKQRCCNLPLLESVYLKFIIE